MGASPAVSAIDEGGPIREARNAITAAMSSGRPTRAEKSPGQSCAAPGISGAFGEAAYDSTSAASAALMRARLGSRRKP